MLSWSIKGKGKVLKDKYWTLASNVVHSWGVRGKTAMNGSWLRNSCCTSIDQNLSNNIVIFIASWNRKCHKEVYYTIHSAGWRSDFCKYSDNWLTWVTATLGLNFVPLNRPVTLTDMVEWAFPHMKRKISVNICSVELLFWLSWIQIKDQNQWGGVMVFSGQNLYFRTKYGAEEIKSKDPSAEINAIRHWLCEPLTVPEGAEMCFPVRCFLAVHFQASSVRWDRTQCRRVPNVGAKRPVHPLCSWDSAERGRTPASLDPAVPGGARRAQCRCGGPRLTAPPSADNSPAMSYHCSEKMEKSSLSKDEGTCFSNVLK